MGDDTSDRMEGPLLSVSTPTYHRPGDLVRALRSVVADAMPDAPQVELVVSDNSTDSRSEEAARPILEAWPGPTKYVRHQPSLDKTSNQNACVELATGRWQLILHDDDYLLHGGLHGLLDGIRAARADERVLLYGVRVVDGRGRRLRHQRFRRRRQLRPVDALRRVLTNSSFVRMPAICVRRDAYQEVGLFDGALGNMNDHDMWLRLFARFGVTVEPTTVSAYVVHTQAATAGLFNADGIDQIHELFRRAAALDLLSADELRRRKRAYLHQFILAGSVRHIRRGDWVGAREVLRLFDLSDVACLGWSRRWSAVRVGLVVLVGAVLRGRR